MLYKMLYEIKPTANCLLHLLGNRELLSGEIEEQGALYKFHWGLARIQLENKNGGWEVTIET